MSTTTTPKIHVVLKRPRPVSALISLAQAIEAAMTSAKVTFPVQLPRSCSSRATSAIW